MAHLRLALLGIGLAMIFQPVPAMAASPTPEVVPPKFGGPLNLR